MTMPATLACSRYFVNRHIGIWILLGGFHKAATAVGIYTRTTREIFSVTVLCKIGPETKGACCLLHMTLMQLHTQRHRMQLNSWQPCILSKHTTRALLLAKTKLVQLITSTLVCDWALHQHHIAFAMSNMYACTSKEEHIVGHCTEWTLRNLCYKVLHRCDRRLWETRPSQDRGADIA